MSNTHRNRICLPGIFQTACVVFLLCSLASCSFFFPNKMLKTPKGYAYVPLSETNPEYQLMPGDQFEMFVFSNSGDKLVDPILVSTGMTTSDANPVSLRYEIDIAGNVNLPVLGITHLAGKTEAQAMQYLQELYAGYYVKPYVHVYIVNKRLIVYRANMNAQVIPITNKNMTIAEAIAAAGGLTSTGKAKEIKIVRQHPDSLQVSMINLTTLEGLQQANKVVQPNDVIYIESNINSDFIKEVAPIITTITSIILAYIYISSQNNP